MKTSRKIYRISESVYWHLRDETGGGICLACGEIEEDEVEPDAERYVCSACDLPRVYGIEQALIMGRLEITPDSDNPALEESDYPD